MALIIIHAQGETETWTFDTDILRRALIDATAARKHAFNNDWIQKSPDFPEETEALNKLTELGQGAFETERIAKNQPA